MRYSLFILFSIISTIGLANPGDTTIVQTYTWEEQNNPNTAYDYPGRRFFTFPEDDGTTYQKILMYYNLKCFEDGTAGNLGFPCGEWDYLSYTYLYHNTGELDSNLASHPRFLWDNSNFETAWITTEEVYDTYQYPNYFTSATNVINEVVFADDFSELIEENVIGGSYAGRSQFIWTSEELTAMGLSAGPIHKISIPVGQSGGFTKRFKVKIRQANVNGLNQWIETNWQTVYDSDTEWLANESLEIVFYSPFNWNGTSDLGIEFSYTNYQDFQAIPLLCATNPTINGLTYSGLNMASHFNNRDQIIAHLEQLEQLNSNITVGFWMYGDPAIQPQNGTTFEAINADNNRIINVHSPWSNGRIYWDCGNDNGAYDRIDKLANETQYEGKWNHWVFTKDANTGVMRMFVNGAQFHAATGLDNSIADITRMVIGSSAFSTNFYGGALDEFILLKSTLPLADVQLLQREGIAGLGAYSNDILLYHNFDQLDYSLVDNANAAYSSYHLGSPTRMVVPGEQSYSKGNSIALRPAISFYRGEYETTDHTSEGSYTWKRPQTSLVEFGIDGYEVVELSRAYYYPGGYFYVYDSAGEKIDSTWIASSTTINNEQYEYWQAPFEVKERYELGRYITPYGINLTLGAEGWTWIYDVTDFEPFLHGEVELEAGNWQELLDLKFVFIEGPAVREVKRVENIWNGDFSLNGFDQVVTERTLGREEGEEGVKLRTTVTGHGFGFDSNNCGEFCYNTHTIEVNGQDQWSWEIMEDCDKNPLYPQGGTWIYARAGWCPGQEGTTQEFELTPYFSGDEITVDYDITYDPYGNYVTESQAVFYGPILQQNDLEIDRIIAPSNWKIDSRMNPLCNDPVVVIRNRGANPITNATITYSVAGGAAQTFEWTGNLGFMESDEVPLTYNDPIMWEGDDETLNFIVDISADDNNANNHAESKFVRPPVYAYNGLADNRMIVIIRTNSFPQENSWTLYNINEEIVAERIGFNTPNTFFRDTLYLNEGCYKFVLRDSDGDGLGFFANNDGVGQAKLDRVEGTDFKVFNVDFGREIVHHFYFATDLVNVEEKLNQKHSAFIYPNPVGDLATISFSGDHKAMQLRILGLDGKTYLEQQAIQTQNNEVTLSTSQLSAGLYLVQLIDGDVVYSLKMMVQ